MLTDSFAPGMRPRWSDPDDPILKLPKVSLHDHLDGSLRPETMVELASTQQKWLPYKDVDLLASWYQGRIKDPVVDNWDDKFGITTSLMQDADSIARVATEFVLDLAADGVVYGETRWAPEKHQAEGLTLDEAVDAVSRGIRHGQALAKELGHDIRVRQILCGMRTAGRSREIAELAARRLDSDVVAFDLAGEEAGFPASEHLDALHHLWSINVPYTLHAGEHAGLDSLRDTVQSCRPLRIGHGVRVVEDMSIDGKILDLNSARDLYEASGKQPSKVQLGPVARWIRDREIPLEVCLSSNSHSIVKGVVRHPLGLLKDLGFKVTVNPDNRLFSATCVSREMRTAVDEFGWGLADLYAVTKNAAAATFQPPQDRLDLLNQLVEPAFAAIQHI